MAKTEIPANPANVIPDAHIMAAMARYRAARATYNALPHSADPGISETPEERAQWEHMDAAEAEIMEGVATSPRGVEAKLWLALMHFEAPLENEQAAMAGDLDYFRAREESLDWGERMIVSAIASLRSMAAA